MPKQQRNQQDLLLDSLLLTVYMCGSEVIEASPSNIIYDINPL